MVLLDEYMFKSVIDNLSYHPSVGNILEVAMHLLKLDKHEHGNSIYFTRDMHMFSKIRSQLCRHNF